MKHPPRLHWLLAIGLSLAACAQRSGVVVQQMNVGRLGPVEVFAGPAPRQACVFLFSDADGWTADLQRAATTLAASSAIVVGVDLRAYLRGLAASDDGCHYVISEIEELSHQLQRQHGFVSYRSPILAGIGAGGALVYAALAQAPSATIAGALAVYPATALKTKVPLCAGATTHATDGGFAYAPRADLPGWWRTVAREPIVPEATPLATTAGTPADTLVAALAVQQRLEAGESLPGEPLDLPLVEYPAASHGRIMTVIYSGDGGWRDLDKQIGDTLAKRGVPVVGIDSLRYFWHEKSPEQMAHDLARIIDVYGARWDTPKVAVVGYSFGADVVPFAVNRLPEKDRAAIVQISLLGLESTALFEIDVRGWIVDVTGDHPVLPELLRLDLERVQCFYGEEEKDTLCRSPELVGAEIIRTEGGHHFGGDYSGLAKKIIEGFQVRSGSAT